MTTLLDEKNALRTLLALIRRSISQERREEAAQKLVQLLYPQIYSFHAVLSFHSFGTEIDTSLLNFQLAKEKKLLLPKVSSSGLAVYSVANPCAQLKLSWGNLSEPDPDQCALVDLSAIDCILVPGLAFDADRRRIGYGKGHYDRFLAQFNALVSRPKTIGIGFNEQLHKGNLPHEPHDLSVDQIFLV